MLDKTPESPLDPAEALDDHARSRLHRLVSSLESVSTEQASVELQYVERLHRASAWMRPKPRTPHVSEIAVGTITFVVAAMLIFLTVESDIHSELTVSAFGATMNRDVSTSPIRVVSIEVETYQSVEQAGLGQREPLYLDAPGLLHEGAPLSPVPVHTISISARSVPPDVAGTLTMGSMLLERNAHFDWALRDDRWHFRVTPEARVLCSPENGIKIEAPGNIEVSGHGLPQGVQAPSSPHTVHLRFGCGTTVVRLRPASAESTMLPRQMSVRDIRFRERPIEMFETADSVRALLSSILGGKIRNVTMGTEAYVMGPGELLDLRDFSGDIRGALMKRDGLAFGLDGRTSDIYVGSWNRPRNLAPSAFGYGLVVYNRVFYTGAVLSLIAATLGFMRWFHSAAS